MSINAASVAYATVGGIVLYSGFKGSTLSDTVKTLLSGSTDVADTETIGSGTTPGTDATVTAGSASSNYETIANYLVGNGYSKAAAAGICGCIAGESSGNPLAVENSSDPGSGGIGLIQWTPGSAYPAVLESIQSGNATTAMQAQLPAIIEYNNGIGANYISMLNQQTDPVGAADFYSQYFEKPASLYSDVEPSIAQEVYGYLTSSASASGAVASTGGQRLTT